LSLQAAHRGIERVEDTHNIVSTFDPGGQPAFTPWPSSKETSQAPCQNKKRGISYA
jgi:hypothetical protein